MNNRILNGKLALISLGCPKNQVDSEYIAGLLTDAGLEIVDDKSEANYIIINTCGFIEAAIREAIDAILSAGEEIGNGNLRNIIVCGCVAQRFSEEIAESIPEVDAIVGAKSYYQIVDVIRYLDQVRLNSSDSNIDDLNTLSTYSESVADNKINRNELSENISLKSDLSLDNLEFYNELEEGVSDNNSRANSIVEKINKVKNNTDKAELKNRFNLNNALLLNKKYDDSSSLNRKDTLLVKSWEKADAIAHMKGKRLVSSKNYAYLKIAEGCAHHCTYCAIPQIRGPHISRPMEDVLAEARTLIASGYHEIILVAQDLSYYGVDLYGYSRLNELIEELLKNSELKWLRCLYLYPQAINEHFIELMQKDERLCPYVDLPIQHASNKILKRMARRESKEELKSLINNLRSKVPDISIRTTVMLGFPGEDEQDFEELKDFVGEIGFDNMGAFVYSAEQGTAAAKMPNQVDKDIANRRYEEIMSIQQEISYRKLKERVGSRLEVILEKKSDDGIFYIGRSKYEAPEIDNQIYILSQVSDVELNKYYYVEIIDSDEYSLTGVIRDEFIK